MNFGVIGVLILAVSGYIFVSDYSASLTGRVDEYKSVAKMLEFISSSLSSSIEPIGDIVERFLKRGNCVTGFISEMYTFKDGRFELARGRPPKSYTLLYENDKDKLQKIFSEYGRYGIEEQRRILNDSKSYFAQRLHEIESVSEKNKKAANLIYTALFIGVFILVV